MKFIIIVYNLSLKFTVVLNFNHNTVGWYSSDFKSKFDVLNVKVYGNLTKMILIEMYANFCLFYRIFR